MLLYSVLRATIEAPLLFPATPSFLQSLTAVKDRRLTTGGGLYYSVYE